MGDAPGEASTSSVIRDGAVSGVLPETAVFAVHYPGYPSSTARAIETLGGLPEIAKVRSSETGNLELRFRPEDPYSHPAFGELRSSTGLLLRLCKPRGGEHASRGGACEGGHSAEPPPAESLSAEVVARVNHAYHFEGMVDYQHVLGVHAAEARRKKRPWAPDEASDPENAGTMDMDGADVMMMVPPLFSLKDRPEKIVLNPPANLFSKNIQRGVMEHKWEINIERCLAIPFDIENILVGLISLKPSYELVVSFFPLIMYIRIPEKFNWEDHISRDNPEWEWQVAVSKLFDEKPIWPRWSFHERLLDDGQQVSENQLKRLLFRAGYYFSTGPYGRFWVRKGYDPRTDPESRIFQKVDFRVPPQLRNLEDKIAKTELKQTQKELCHFKVWPSKSFICLQLFELDDDFIQQEIRKPTRQTACSHTTGWFSGAILRTLRLHVSIRFLSLYPNDAAKQLTNYTRELFERSKKNGALSRLQKSEKEDQLVNRDTTCSAEVTSIQSNEHGHMDPDRTDNCEIEDEEEEEELDGYESPPACEDGFFPDGGNLGEQISNDYLEELLRGFPFNKESKDRRPDDAAGAGDSDGEYQIFEQDSDDNENFLDDDDGFS
ncbi:unnamed protein product [Musa banksii]